MRTMEDAERQQDKLERCKKNSQRGSKIFFAASCFEKNEKIVEVDLFYFFKKKFLQLNFCNPMQMQFNWFAQKLI